MNRAVLIAAATLMLLAAPVAAQMDGDMDHSAMDHGAMAGMDAAPKGDAGPSSQAFAKANAAMHAAMDIEFSGNADVDFVRGMIEHHRGAIAMAKVQLEFGKDAQMRKLAEDIIAAQTKEIADMEAWLKANGG